MSDEKEKEIEDLEPQKDATGGAASADAIYMKNRSADGVSLDGGSSLDRGGKSLD